MREAAGVDQMKLAHARRRASYLLFGLRIVMLPQLSAVAGTLLYSSLFLFQMLMANASAPRLGLAWVSVAWAAKRQSLAENNTLLRQPNP